MGVDADIDITTEDRKTVLALLKRNLPGTAVWVYGSRVKWTSRPQSDLDLVVFATPAQRGQVGDLREAFEESNLPFRVDLFVWMTCRIRSASRFRRSMSYWWTQGPRDMSDEWVYRRLEDCMESIIDYRGKTPRKTSSGIPLITAKVVKRGRIETPTEFIALDHYASWMRRGMPQSGDVLITTEAPLGEVAQLQKQRVALAQRLILLRGKSRILDNRFLSFLLQSDEVQVQLRARATGTTVLGIKQKELRQIEFSLPPIAEQRAIAHILGNTGRQDRAEPADERHAGSDGASAVPVLVRRFRPRAGQDGKPRHGAAEGHRRPVPRPARGLRNWARYHWAGRSRALQIISRR